MFRFCFKIAEQRAHRICSLTLLTSIGPLTSISAGDATKSRLPGIEIFLSGSSALDESLESLMRMRSDVPGIPSVCQTDTLDTYRSEIDGVTRNCNVGLVGGATSAAFRNSR